MHSPMNVLRFQSLYLHQNVDFSTYEGLPTMTMLGGLLIGVKDAGKVQNLGVAKSRIIICESS